MKNFTTTIVLPVTGNIIISARASLRTQNNRQFVALIKCYDEFNIALERDDLESSYSDMFGSHFSYISIQDESNPFVIAKVNAKRAVSRIDVSIAAVRETDNYENLKIRDLMSLSLTNFPVFETKNVHIINYFKECGDD